MEKESILEVEMFFLRVDAGRIEERKDFIAVEQPIHVLINQEHYATILCTPTDVPQLVLGNLISEGLINSMDEIKEISAKEDGEFQVILKSEINLQARLTLFPSFKRLILSACGSSESWPLSKLIDRIRLPRVEVKDQVEAKTILEATRQLNVLATTFKRTGGVHAAALYLRDGERVSFSEDIGRHNA
ncbi:formate dehydrogenase accessory sulfurtransferase FdhD, partial [Candidatus Bathyarchaeota archaeon]|nr:formate dehydrogenase accessory sulfurtransferase FdhD [Candidatus Bathyarchaeota archaeon]